jgi:TonB family protein
MKKIKLCTAMLLLACCLTAHAAEKREQTYRVGADVNAGGHVTATQVDKDVPASIAAVLGSALKQWQFVPATRNGHSLPAHTFVYTKLQAFPNASGQYNLRVSYIGNGPRIQQNKLPRYPAEGIRQRESAFTVLEATVQIDGRLSDLKVSSKFENWPLPIYFKEAVLASAKQWHGIPEQVDGQPVATQVRIPVSFTLDRPQFTEAQIKILREAARKEDATAEAEAARPAIPLPSDQEVALDSPLQPRAVATITSAP